MKYDVQNFTREQLIEAITTNFEQLDPVLLKEAHEVGSAIFHDKIYFRGLIEISNYCKKGCYYCGINCTNKTVERYRLSKEDILNCCQVGYDAGLRTFVLQGGEDHKFTDELLVDIIITIRQKYPDCAITLSLGERSKQSYQKLYNAGANRYLLRHETITEEHYNKLHPLNHKLSDRIECLNNLKEIGFQTGAGVMVGSPYQTVENLADDLLFFKELQPHMVGIGPFIPQKDTVFGDFPSGTIEQTVTILALTRLMLPNVLLPATTALNSLGSNGRALGFSVSANVIMPNLSPANNREKYALYDGKVQTGIEVAENINTLIEGINKLGYEVDLCRGDHPTMN